MSEEWRRKKYYRTRVLIPVDECLESEFGDCLVCLTGGQLNLVRNLLLYAERRSTFVSEYHEQYYLAPSAEEWDSLQELVSDLEGNLMDCEQFTTDLQEILDWVRLQAALPGGSFSEDEEAAFPYTDEIEDDELTPAEEEACAIAQLWFEWGYQTITESVLPATRWGFDYLIPALTAFIATAIGGPAAGAGVWVLAEFIQEIMEIGYRGAETNLVNWMDTNKEDIVCVLFKMLVENGYASAIWQRVEDLVIDPAEDISYGDKLMLSLFMGTWAGGNASRAFEAETEWATSNVEEGYCDECPELPAFLQHHYEFPSDTNWETELPNSFYQPSGELQVQNQGWAYSPSYEAPPAGDYTLDLNAYGTDGGSGWQGDVRIQGSDDEEEWTHWLQFQTNFPTYPTRGPVYMQKTGETWPEYEYVRYASTTLFEGAVLFGEIDMEWTPE